jgi:hypothetical protein
LLYIYPYLFLAYTARAQHTHAADASKPGSEKKRKGAPGIATGRDEDLKLMSKALRTS